MLTRRELLAGSICGAPMLAAAARRPNIVFIFTDDQRWDSMSCAGHPFLKTPNMDRIAREGAMFTNSFVTTPLCSPARASFLTGRYVHAHGVRGNGNMYNELSHQLVTWPRLLHDAGYETGYVGKFHMGNDDMPRPGFDRWVSFKGQGVYDDPPLNVDGKPVNRTGYITDLIGEYSTEFLRRKRSKPFVLYVGHKAVHGPFTPAPRHKDFYSTEPIPRRPNVKDTLEGKPAVTRDVPELKKQQAKKKQGPSPSGDALIRNQLRGLLAVDESIGEVFKALEETGQLDNTLLIFTSDNGYFWGEHGLGDKRWSYEESIRIPMVMRFPKLIRAGTKIEHDALNVDIAPTALELAGVAAPKNLHGRSLVPAMSGKARKWRKSFLSEYFEETGFQRAPSWQCVRTERWKYTHYTDLQGMDELYDIQADPFEMHNAIRESAARGTVTQMQAELQRLLRMSE
ncbi:MAG: sulfatase [Acidobacteria bacterium]|nr:sulfatase [Acidobacteriota bacterium]